MNRQKKRKELDIPIDAFTLMSVGELNENKNHSVIIKAIGHLKMNKVYYVIVGKGPLYNQLEKLANEYGVKNRVRLLGFRADIPDLYNAADACVFPSIREGQGIAAIEGMASGLPLIVSDNRGTRGFLTEENAVTCQYNDDEAFADGIKSFMRSANKRFYLGTNNLAKSKDFDKAVVNKRMSEIYSSI